VSPAQRDSVVASRSARCEASPLPGHNVIPLSRAAALRWAERRKSIFANMVDDLVAAGMTSNTDVARQCLLLRGYLRREVDLLAEDARGAAIAMELIADRARFAAIMAQLREAISDA
jgi:hypothetical protein